jgi:hypothetical protein
MNFAMHAAPGKMLGAKLITLPIGRKPQTQTLNK